MENKSFTLTILKYLAPLTIFVTPLLFLPFTANYFGTPQLSFLVIITMILLGSLVADLLFHHTIKESKSPLRLPILIFITSIIVNLLANPGGRTEALAGTATLYLCLSIFAYFLTMVPPSSKLKTHIVIAFISSATLLAVHSILQLTFFHSWSTLPLYMQTKAFTPTGNPLTTFTILIITAISAFTASMRENSQLHKYLYVFAAATTTISATAYLSLMLNGGPLSPIILPLSASWSILLDSLKNSHNLIFGVGFANFSELYNSVKPLFLNSTIFWNILPSTASTEIIQLITTTGLIGTIGFALIALSGLRRVFQTRSIVHSPVAVIFALTTISLFFLPGSIPVFVLFFMSLGILNSEESTDLSVQKNASYFLSLILITLIGFTGFYLTQFNRAEYYLNQARIALKNSDAKLVYESSLKAVDLVPTMSNYRLSYSQVNLSIASSLSQQSDLSDEQKQNVNQLITQALREAKIVTTLRPSDSFAWQNLGKIYANLLTVAEGSDKFAVEAYSQAIALDAGNPALRTDFAILLTQLASTTKVEADIQNYLARASSEFQVAIQLKNDFVPAYYNLSKLLESTGDIPNAVATMQKATELLSSDSPDRVRATEELDILKTKLPIPSPVPET